MAHETFCGYCCGIQPMYQVQCCLFERQQVQECRGLTDYQGRCQAFDETAWQLHALCEQLLALGRQAYRYGLVQTAQEWLSRGYSPAEVAALAQQTRAGRDQSETLPLFPDDNGDYGCNGDSRA